MDKIAYSSSSSDSQPSQKQEIVKKQLPSIAKAL